MFPPLIPILMRLQNGTYVVLIGCVLPIFFCLFLTTGWFLLSILGVHDGPRGGHRVTSRPTRALGDVANASTRT
jgi:hypothetical protein